MSIVGETLYNERIKQGLTVSDVSKKTNIREYYLVSIEKGQFDRLPGDVYAKGFITNYARVVGLDEKFLIAEYKKEIKPDLKDELDIKTQKEDLLPQKESVFSRYQKINVNKALMAKFAIIIFVFSVAIVIFLNLQKTFDNNEQNVLSLKQVDKQNNNTINKSNLINPSQSENSLVNGGLNVINIEILAKDKCWTEVEIDGKSEFYGMLDKDQKKSWNGKKVTIKVGNINAIDIYINNKKYKPTEQEIENFVLKKEFNVADR